MTATVTAAEIVTHAFVSSLVTFEQTFSTREGERLTVGWSEYRTTVDAFRTYDTYGLWRNGNSRMFAANDGVWFELCRRCGGSGNWGYGPDNGVCYLCHGDGHGAEIGDDAELNRRMKTWGTTCRTASNKAEAKYNERQAEIAAWREANADLVTWATALVPSETAEDGTEWCNQYGRKAGCFIRDIRDGVTLEKGPTAYLTKVMASALERAAEDTSRHVGTEGDDITVTGTVIAASEVAGYYGSSMLVSLIATGEHDGAVVRFFSSADPVWDVQVGDTVTVSGTVRKHNVYREVRQTMVKPKRNGLTIL